MISTLVQRLKNACFSWRIAVFGSLIWGGLAGLCVWIDLVWFAGYATPSQARFIALLFSVGALIAFAPSLFVARFFAARKGFWRLACLLVFMALGTVAVTAAVIALEYRVYFTQWHAPAFTRLWVWQQIFTLGGAVYQYIVIGLRFYMPLGLVALLGISLWANRLAH